jgi:hypothetical protein
MIEMGLSRKQDSGIQDGPREYILKFEMLGMVVFVCVAN